jgi:hypothetical protein
LDEVLVFIFTGPCQPTPEELERTLFLVRIKQIGAALEWLKLNHADHHYDIEISHTNLKAYPENGPLVVIEYCKMNSNKWLVHIFYFV